MTIQVGDAVPSAKLSVMTTEGIETYDPAEQFAGKKVVVFAVPGAFTPTCSARHLPGFVDKADEIRSKGVDEIVCMSVNDVFVMAAWGKSQNVGDNITMLADGNGDFTRALGLEMDGTGFGMGQRSQRFAFIADDGRVSALHVEAAGEFNVSSAEAILGAL